MNALRYSSLGPKATIDHENVHGRSLLGAGTPIDEQYFRQFVGKMMWPHDYNTYNAVYCIPFSKDIQGALKGEVDGFHEFRGDRESLKIVTDQNPTETQFKLETDSKQSIGFVVSYKGASFTQAATGTLLSMEQALNNLPTVIEDGVEFRIDRSDEVAPAILCDYALVFDVFVYERGSYAASLTGTVKGQPWVKDICQFQIQSQDPLIGGYWPHTYIHGVQGFCAGTYDIHVYSAYYRHIQEHNGRIEVEDM